MEISFEITSPPSTSTSHRALAAALRNCPGHHGEVLRLQAVRPSFQLRYRLRQHLQPQSHSHGRPDGVGQRLVVETSSNESRA